MNREVSMTDLEMAIADLRNFCSLLAMLSEHNDYSDYENGR
jgi:hypothetical protein